MHGLLLGWSTQTIAKETGAKSRTIQYWHANLIRYQSMNRPPLAALSRRRKLTQDDKEVLKRFCFAQLDNSLANERGVDPLLNTRDRSYIDYELGRPYCFGSLS